MLLSLIVNLTKSLSITFDVALHLRKFAIKSLVHSPVLQIPMIPLKQRTGKICARVLIKEEGVFEGEWPVETRVLRVIFRQIAVLEDLCVVLNEAVTKCWPGEEVDRDGVLCARLRGAMVYLVV